MLKAGYYGQNVQLHLGVMQLFTKSQLQKMYKKLNMCTLVYSLVLESVRVVFYITVLLETVTLEKQQILSGKTSFHNALVSSASSSNENNAY